MSSSSRQQAERRKREGVSSQYQGVTWCKRDSAWFAQIMYKYQNRNLGLYSEEEAAARAYLAEGVRIYGPDFRLEDQKKLGLAN